MAGADEDHVRHVRVRSVNSLLVCFAVLAFSALQPPGLRGAASPLWQHLLRGTAPAPCDRESNCQNERVWWDQCCVQLAEQALYTCPAAVAQLAGASSYGGTRPQARLAHKVQPTAAVQTRHTFHWQHQL